MLLRDTVCRQQKKGRLIGRRSPSRATLAVWREASGLSPDVLEAAEQGADEADVFATAADEELTAVRTQLAADLGLTEAAGVR